MLFDEPRVRASGSSRSPGYLRFMKARSTAAGALSAFFVTGGLTGFLLFLGAYLRTEVGLSADPAPATSFLLSGLAGVFGALAAGRLADRIRKNARRAHGQYGDGGFSRCGPGDSGLRHVRGVGDGWSVRRDARGASTSACDPACDARASRCFRGATEHVLAVRQRDRGGRSRPCSTPHGFQYICWLTAGFSAMAVVLILLIEEPEQGQN